MDDFLATIYDELASELSIAYTYIEQALYEVQYIIAWLGSFAGVVWGILSKLGSWLWRVLKDILTGNFADLWKCLKRIFDRVRQLIAWYQKHILKPLHDMQQAVYRIYNLYFRPIIKILETLRTMVRYLSIFDRKLAALLDAKLVWLEGKVMYPISQALARINSISSTMRAMLTPLGMLDRVLLLESLRRDASKVWQVLTNPMAVAATAVAPVTHRTQTDILNDWHDFTATNSGPYADAAQALTTRFNELISGVD